jgi:SecD/SecF fusion protein
VLAEQGSIPAYAVTTEGQPVEVAPSKRRRARVTANPDEGVSREEFDDMVANLGVETKPVVAPSRRPAGGRRARSQSNGGGETDADGKPRKPRNTRHGRPR